MILTENKTKAYSGNGSIVKRIISAWWLCIGGLLSLQSEAGTIYLCRAYGGGSFWSQATCSQHSALVERTASVPSDLPFDQQVNIAEQQRSAAAALYPDASVGTSTTTTTTTTTTTQNSASECRALDEQIKNYDAMARHPQSGQVQDWITAQKRKARDRQFAIHCQ